MYPVSARFLEVVAGSHRVVSRVRVLADPMFGVPAEDEGTELPLIAGDVKLASTSDVKGTISLEVPGDYWDVVQPYGAEIFVERGIDYGDTTREYVPLGYYRIDQVEQDDAPAGPVRISGSDRIAQMQQNRVLYPYQVPSGTSHRTIFERLVNGRETPTSAVSTAGYGMFIDTIVPIHWTGYDPDTVTVPSGAVVEDSTYEFLAKLADGRSCVLIFSDDGELYIVPRDRDIDAEPIYSILPGETGNLIRASRSVTRDGVYNIVSAYGSDPAHPTGYQLAYNSDVTSPLFWAGRFGPAPRYYASPVLRTSSAALEAAATVLARYTGLPSNLGLFAVPNPALRPLDVIDVNLGGERVTHTIDEVSIPLVGAEPVQIATRQLNPVGTIETDPDPNPDPTPNPDPDPDTGYTIYGVPEYDHIVVLIYENKDRDEINASSAPYLWSLAEGGARMANSFGLFHPSQGNYLALFSGDDHGHTEDICADPQLTVPSLWSQLGSGDACRWYSEDLPADKHACSVGEYLQWHNGMQYFAGTDAQNLDWTAFPSDFTQLPRVAFVTPNLLNDMHDGPISQGDAWALNNIDAYAQWARNNNSLLIVTFDESQQSNPVNDIFTCFYGAKVQQGVYTQRIDHYDVLRTIEAACNLPGIGNAADRTPITECWVPPPDPDPGGGGGEPTGAVTVSGRQFRRGGDRFIWLGDTAWGLFTELTREEVDLYLDTRAAQGFNVIQACCTFAQAGGQTNRYGHSPGNLASPNDAFFAHIDYVVQAAAQRNMVMALLPIWADGQIGSALTSGNAHAYGQFLGQRYGNKDNVLWIFGGDFSAAGYEGIWNTLADGLAAGGSTAPETYHPRGQQSSTDFTFDGWLDFHMMHGSHCLRYDDIATDRAACYATGRAWLDGEPIYEDHPICWDAPANGFSSPLDVRRMAYWAMVGGAAGHTYGHHVVWPFSTGNHPFGEDGAPGHWTDAINDEAANQMRYVKALFASRPRVEPADSLVSDTGSGADYTPASIDAAASTIIVYFAARQARTVNVGALAGATARPWWFNPRTGQASALATVAASGQQTFTPPSGGEDWVLVLDDAGAGYSAPGTSGGTPDPGPGPGTGERFPADPGELLWIGRAGSNHYNVGVGATDGHVDHSEAEIRAGYEESPQFRLTPDKTAVQFSVSVDAATTSENTQYPRSELREFKTDGTTRAAWDAGSGTHYMYGTSRVTHVAATKPWVVIAQIHGADDDILRIQTQGSSPSALQLVARWTPTGGSEQVVTLLSTYMLGEDIEWRIDAVNGQVTVTVNGTPTVLPGSLTEDGCYFKAGCYAQSNTDTENGDSSQFFSVELRDFVTWHTGYPATTTPVYTGTDDGGTPPPDPDPSDGTQAAVLLGWGAVIAGDEFNYTGAPRAPWSMYDGPGHDGNGIRTPDAYSVANGYCTCYGDAAGNTGGMAFQHDSYGYRVEVRMRTYSIDPSAGGHRYHPVLILWPQSNEWPEGAEYDFFESDCDSGEFGLFMHLPNHEPYRQDHVEFPLDIENWHNYACEWDPVARTLKTWVDGELVYDGRGRVAEAPGPMHLTSQLDNFFGSGMCPAKMEMAWVRIYRRPNA